MLYSTLQSDARKWETTGDATVTNPSYKNTLAAMKAGSDISGVTVSDFFLLSKSDAESVSQSSRIVYNESGYADFWWLATPGDYDSAYNVSIDGDVNGGSVNDDNYGIAPGFSISAN